MALLSNGVFYFGSILMTIYFYSQRGAYGEFSNFSPHSFTLDGYEWPTAEHYFQAQKFQDQAHQARIRQAPTPAEAKRLGQMRGFGFRGDWESVKEVVMMRALVAKFSAHPQLKSLLLTTGQEPLVEKARNDSYWGCGADGKGRNRLGMLLMALRDQIQQ